MPHTQPPGGWTVRRCVAWSTARFQEHAALLILATLPVVAVIGIAQVAAAVLLGTPDEAAATAGDLGATLREAVAGFVALLAIQVAAIAPLRLTHAIAAGRPPDLRAAYRLDGLAPVVLTAAIVSAVATAGFLLLYVPGFVALFATGYALFFVVDAARSPLAALGDSLRLVLDHLADTVVWFLLAAVVVVVGALALLVGLVVALPLVLLGTSYTHRVLTGPPAGP
ncbi:hypothetical protein KUV85_16090 [Nocardioides panacisoli]|uniref:hypothetical protein n=1 Tax=Nocardioides panacisoli TaxID=627624 RepID=UPI001C62A7C6|nr:hypothetical protein [Nocardioides panacisoli]QYJ03826.1 hypothetical protein KUV85_16090 [Nocardioides panacisoli]